MNDAAGTKTSDDEVAETAYFDGVICFGGVDWWYHNRGHYDLQMMRELSRSVPVLYINSVGMRSPTVGEGAMFARRVARKLKSLTKGLQVVSTNFFVYSARTPPGGSLSSSFFSASLARQVRRCANKIGIRRPLIWVACPPAAHVLDRMENVGVVYQRTDRMEEFEGANTEYISELDALLKRNAGLTVFCARELYEWEKDQCANSTFIDHGVDFERFVTEATRQEREGSGPRELGVVPRPRIGFVGGIDSHTFDTALFLEVAERLPNCQFVLVGACSLRDGWCRLDNVHQLGQRLYEMVPSYMAACDVLIMPWNRNEWIMACNPVKLKEYLATGKPVVSTPFPELEHYSGHVAVAQNAEEFATQIMQKIREPDAPEHLRARVSAHTWEQKARDLLASLAQMGLSPRSSNLMGKG